MKILELKKIENNKFIPLLQKYYGLKHYESYHRSDSSWGEVTNYRNASYAFYDKENIVGGVIITNSVVVSMFTIPPFDDYELLLTTVIDKLKADDKLEHYSFEEVPDMYKEVYLKKGFNLCVSEMMMHMKTKAIDTNLPKGFSFDKINIKDIEEMAEVIKVSFDDNPAYGLSHNKSDFIDAIKSYFNYIAKEPELFNSTYVVKSEHHDIVGVCLSMIDSNLPFVMHLAVLPQYQNLGIGRFLTESIINGVKDKYSKVRLFVIEGNSAKKLYSSIGFIAGESIHNFKYK